MKRLLLLIFLLQISITLKSQKVISFETDSFTYFIDTETSNSLFEDVYFNGQVYVGTVIDALSEYDGISNTQKIVDSMGVNNIPAYRCDTLNLSGKTDWYLPSKNESLMIYDSINTLGHLPTGWYWTSTEANNREGRVQPWIWLKWFGTGEGNLIEQRHKSVPENSFCMRRESKILTSRKEIEKDESLNFYYTDLNGKKTAFKFNKILLKVYSNSYTEKVLKFR